MRKKRDFKSEQERHKKRQALWDGVKKLRNGEEAALEISGKIVNTRPLPEDLGTHIENNLSTHEFLYIVEIRKGKLVLGMLVTKDCDLSLWSIVAGKVNDEIFRRHLHRKHILGCCRIKEL